MPVSMLVLAAAMLPGCKSKQQQALYQAKPGAPFIAHVAISGNRCLKS
jgi:hypothetical protein